MPLLGKKSNLYGHNRHNRYENVKENIYLTCRKSEQSIQILLTSNIFCQYDHKPPDMKTVEYGTPWTQILALNLTYTQIPGIPNSLKINYKLNQGLHGPGH